MATPRKVASLNRLVAQIDALYPQRSKASDGWIGDLAHSNRKSDHNPDADGTVDARDITHDTKKGLDIAELVTVLIAQKDRRVSYIIANGQIISGNAGPSPWKRRTYKGANKHTKHIHISVLDKYQDDGGDWNLTGLTPRTSKPAKEPALDPKQAILQLGAKGKFVEDLQIDLKVLGFYRGPVDGNFSASVETAVKAFQRANKTADGDPLKVDGIAGKRTTTAIGAALEARETKPVLDAAKKAVVPVAKQTLAPGEMLAGVTAIGSGATAIKETVDAVNDGTASLLSMGPWLLAALFGVGFGVYVWRDLRAKKAAAVVAAEAME